MTGVHQDLSSSLQALSNQKYREMLAEFGDVGLMTGDVTINPTASCLVMTTEVSRAHSASCCNADQLYRFSGPCSTEDPKLCVR